jgi:hypothetical protein
LEGKDLARFSRNVGDAAIRGSFDIYTDSISRMKYRHENPPGPEVAQLPDQEEVDFAIQDDEEQEPTHETKP